MVASYSGHFECVKELIMQGADINYQREVCFHNNVCMRINFFYLFDFTNLLFLNGSIYCNPLFVLYSLYDVRVSALIVYSML